MRRFMRPSVFSGIALVAVTATILSFVSGSNLDASVSTPVQPARAKAGAQSMDPGARLERLVERLERRRAGAQQEKPAIPDWNPPIPIAAVVQPEATPSPPPAPVERKPEAPPLPFTYVGQMETGGKMEIFLGQGADAISAKAGDTVAEVYRIDQITAQAVMFTHLPTGIQQMLPVPAQY